MIKTIKNWIEILLTVFSMIIIRNLLEMLLKRPGSWSITTFNDWIGWWFHFPLFYLALWISGALGFSMLLRITFQKSARIAAVFLLLILIGPIVDLFFNMGSIPYLYVKDPHDAYVVLINLLNPFQNLFSFGIPYGPRVEMFLTILFLPFAIWKFSQESKIKRLFSIVSGILFVYLGIYFLCCWPALLKTIILHSELSLSFTDSIYAEVYLLVIIIVLIISFFRSSLELKSKIGFFLRPYRLGHYFLLVLAGFWLSFDMDSLFIKKESFYLFCFILDFLVGIAAFFLVFIATTIANDYTDQREDQINRINFFEENPENKTGSLLLCTLLFVLSLLLSFSVSSGIFSVVLLWSALSFVYSFPPLRLKRYLFLSNFILAAAASLAVLYGAMIAGNPSPIVTMRTSYFILIFLITFLGSFIKDIPDTRGDSVSKVITIPVLFDPGKFKGFYLIFIVACYFITFLLTVRISYGAYFLFVPTIISSFSILKKPYENRLLYISYFISIIIVSGCFKSSLGSF